MTELKEVGPGLGLIVPGDSGTTFTNQCGGHASLHGSLEGDDILLRDECEDSIAYFWLVVGGYS